MPEKLVKAVGAAKRSIWKYFGAAFMEQKDGVQAISLTRSLALVCFAMLAWKWSALFGTVDPAVVEALEAAKIDVPMALKHAKEIPDTLLYTFWGLIGGKTAETMIAKLKKGA